MFHTVLKNQTPIQYIQKYILYFNSYNKKAVHIFSLHCVCTIFPSFPPEFSPASTELLNPASARKRRKKIHNVQSTQLNLSSCKI